MAQESRLVIVVDSKGAKTNADELARAMVALESAGVRVTRSTSEVSSTMRNMASEADAAAISIKRGLTAALGGLSAMKVIDIADEWGQFASRIRMATKSTEEYEFVQKRMAKSAQITFRAINETRESFIQMSPVLRDMGLSLEHSIDAIDTFSGLLVVNGANAQRGAAAMEALAKSLQRGRIDAQAWMTIYSTVDNVVDLLADTTGKTTDEIRRLGIEGKISAEMIATALVQGNEKVIKAVEEMPTTVRDAMQNVNTAFSEYIGRTNEANQVTATLAEGMSLLGNNLDSVLNVAIVAAGVGLTAYSAKTALALVETGKLTAAKIAEAAASRNGAIATEMYAKARLAEAQATVASATGMQQRLTLVQTTLIPAQRQLEAATKAVAVANRGLGASMLGLVGGPVGAITLAAGLAATAFLTLKSSTNESREAFEDFGKGLDELTGKWKTLTVAQNEALRGRYVLSESLAEEALLVAKKSLDSALASMGEGFTGSSAQLKEFVENINAAEGDTAALVAVLRQAESAGVLDPEATQSVIDYAGVLDGADKSHKKAITILKEHLQFMKEFSSEAGVAADRSGHLSNELTGLSETDFTKLVSGLHQTLDLIGMSAQQAAEYKARLEGANEQQAQLAGVLAGMADAARMMEKATQEKDEKAEKGAQALLDKLIEQEVQLRMNMTRAAEYAALIGLGIEATIAAQGADTAAQLEGLKAQEEIVARIKSITANIGKNTVPSLKKVGEATKNLAGEIDNLVGSLFPAIKAESDWIKQQKLLDQALKKGKITQEQYTKGLAKLQEAYELIAFEVPKHVQAIKDETQSIKSSIPSLRQRVDTFGLSATAIARNAEAETRARIATLNNIKAVEVAKGASKEYVKQIEQEIDALKELLIQQEHQTGLLDKSERQEAEQKYYQDMADTAKRAHEEIERSLTDALMRGFESGKDFGRNFIDTLKNMFGSLVLRPIIQPIAAGAAGMITGALGFGGTANAQGMGGGIDPITGLSTAKNLMGGMSWFTDFTGTMGGSLMDAGMYLQKFDGIVGDFGNTILGNIDTIAGAAQMAGAAWNYGKGIYDLTKGSYGAGIGAIGGQLLGGPIGGMIGNALGGMLDKAFKGETRAGAYMQYDLAAKQAIVKGGPSGGYGGQATIDAATQLFGSTVDTINSVLEGVGAQAQTAWFHGMFESSKKGRGGTFAGGSMQLADGSLVDFGTNKKGDGFGGKSGTAEEMFQNLQAEVHFAALEAWKAVGSEMPTMISDMLGGMDIRALSAEQAQGAVAEITGLVGSVNMLTLALNQLPMTNLHELTFDAKAGLTEFFGGLDQVTSGLGLYYQEFYSESERAAHTTKLLTDAFGRLGYELPASRDALRDIIDGIDVTTREGQELYARLVQLAPTFASVTDATAGLNDNVESIQRLMSQIAQLPFSSLTLLGEDAVRSLAAMGGGVEAFSDGLSGFYQGFYSESERHAQSLLVMSSELRDLNQVFPSTKDGFRDLVHGLDLSTEAGQKLYASLMGMSGAAAGFYDYVAQKSEASFRSVSAEITASRDEYLKSLQTRHQAAQKAIRDEYAAKSQAIRNSITSVNEKLRDLNGVFSALGTGIKSLREQSALASQLHRDVSLRVIDDAIKASKAGKSLSGFADLQDSISSVSRLDANNFTSLFDFELERAETVTRLKELEALTGGQIDVQELQLDSLNKQIEQLSGWQDRQLELLQKQHESAQNRAHVRFEKMLTDEKARFDAELTQMMQQQANQLLINDSITAGSLSTAHGLSAVQSAIDASASRISSAVSNMRINVSMPSFTGLNLPAFADGGYYRGGLALVGERGPEIINFSKPGMVYTNAQSQNLLGGGGDNRELVKRMDQLISMLSNVSYETRAVAVSVAKLLDVLKDVTQGGTELRTTVVS